MFEKKELSYKLLFFNTHTNTENEIQKDFNIYKYKNRSNTMENFEKENYNVIPYFT